jgi:membrane protein implicated in regulation of membrane protease activity
MTPSLAMSPGIFIVLIFWVLWYLLDPPLRPEGLSWPRLLLWIFTPLGMYLVLSKVPHPEALPAPPVGKEGTVASLDPLEVEVFGSFWHARCDSVPSLRPGDRVIVLKREGLTLVVERHS